MRAVHSSTRLWGKVSMLAIGALAAGTAIGLAPGASAAPVVAAPGCGIVPVAASDLTESSAADDTSKAVTFLAGDGKVTIDAAGLKISNGGTSADQARVFFPYDGSFAAANTLGANGYKVGLTGVSASGEMAAVTFSRGYKDATLSPDEYKGYKSFFIEAPATRVDGNSYDSATATATYTNFGAWDVDNGDDAAPLYPSTWTANGWGGTTPLFAGVSDGIVAGGKLSNLDGITPAATPSYVGIMMDEGIAGSNTITSLTVGCTKYVFSTPTASFTGKVTGVAGSAVTTTATVTGANGVPTYTDGVPGYTYSLAAGAPSWMSIGPASGVITGTPGLNDYTDGDQTVTVTVTDSVGQTADTPVTYNITPADPTLKLSAATLTGTVGKAISPITATATPGKNPLTFSAAGLPAGLSLNATNGQITGTPAKAGAGTFTVTVKDAAGKTATATVVYAFNSAAGLTINVDKTVTGTAGTAIDPIVVKPLGGNAPYTVKVDGLPAGLGYDASTGTISGTPKVAGNGTITVTSTDADGNVATAAISYKFAAAAPACTTTRELKANVSLKGGQRLKTCNGTYSFVMQGDGNLVMYKSGKATFSTHTVGKGGVRFVAQSDGSMVMYNKAGKTVWYNRAGIPKTSPVQKLTLNESGKLVVTFKNSKTYTWAPQVAKK